MEKMYIFNIKLDIALSKKLDALCTAYGNIKKVQMVRVLIAQAKFPEVLGKDPPADQADQPIKGSG